MSFRSLALPLLLAGCLAAASPALAQHGGGGGAPGGGGGGMGGRPTGGSPMGSQPGSLGTGTPGYSNSNYGSTRRDGNPPPNSPDQQSTMRGGLQLGPPGRWWDDKHFAKDLKLSNDQQKRMDSIFEQSRPALLKRYEELMQEQDRMESLTHAKTLDENALFAQIDRIAQARAALEKANTHLLYQIRAEMDAEQLSRLESHR